MTAPGQEPDEVLTSTPDGRGEGAAAPPDLDGVGDNHLPDDLRRQARADAGGPDAEDGQVDGEPDGQQD